MRFPKCIPVLLAASFLLLAEGLAPDRPAAADGGVSLSGLSREAAAGNIAQGGGRWGGTLGRIPTRVSPERAAGSSRPTLRCVSTPIFMAVL